MNRWLLIFLSTFFFACEKEDFNTNPNASLLISTDSIFFDTIFTGKGSVTAQFKISNTNKEKILISNIRLGGSSSSPYRLNINGAATNNADNIELAGEDSMYVFVALTINPDSARLPFLVKDSIQISYNGNNRWVHLQAFGQNAHYLQQKRISRDTTWTNDLPYVISGGLEIDSGITLQLEAGCRLYFHAGASLKVNGILRVNGLADSMVVFAGDRLDEYYRDLPGSWQGIVFSEKSKNNSLSFACIKNSVTGIEITEMPVTAGFKLELSQCIIQQALDAGIFSLNSSIRADNCLLSNCGQSLVIAGGGDYVFRHCTLAGYSTNFQLHKKPVAYVSDGYVLNGTIVTHPLMAELVNCILWGEEGSLGDELITEKAGSSFNINMSHCLLKASGTPSHVSWINGILNEDPLFDSVDAGNNYFDFHCRNNPSSPAINTGIVTGLSIDLDGLPRNVQAPDLGCYEKQ